MGPKGGQKIGAALRARLRSGSFIYQFNDRTELRGKALPRGSIF